MNKIIFGDNLEELKKIPDESIDLIYIDPPFNTKKTQKYRRIKTIKDENGDRTGYKGNKYKTVDLSIRSYEDKFDSLIDFLFERMTESYRVLSSHGALYFHIDYRESHRCKLMLDEIFINPNCFINEIIWAYDYGGRSKNKWSSKHDTIFFYVKDPKNYTFNFDAMERIPYMAPGLVGEEKAKKGKTPTDVWWHTIVPTNGKERIGYPSQKPKGIIKRIIEVSSKENDTVLDFFAGSGTVGDVCNDLNRNFILIDNNYEAIEVMQKRFEHIHNKIEWI